MIQTPPTAAMPTPADNIIKQPQDQRIKLDETFGYCSTETLSNPYVTSIVHGFTFHHKDDTTEIFRKDSLFVCLN